MPYCSFIFLYFFFFRTNIVPTEMICNNQPKSILVSTLLYTQTICSLNFIQQDFSIWFFLTEIRWVFVTNIFSFYYLCCCSTKTTWWFIRNTYYKKNNVEFSCFVLISNTPHTTLLKLRITLFLCFFVAYKKNNKKY